MANEMLCSLEYLDDMGNGKPGKKHLYIYKLTQS